MIYLDTSAMLKLVWDEPESRTPQDWLNERLDTPLVSSVLGTIELIRACRRYDDAAISDGHALLDQVNLIPMRTDIVESASHLGDPKLRSLDAIHLASALTVRAELSVIRAYDHRLRGAAGSAGLTVAAPGQ